MHACAALQTLFKQMAQKPGAHQSTRTSAEAGPYTFHVLTEGGVCYLTLAERGYPKKLAYGFLEELQKEFSQLYGPQIESATRPYAFIKFGTCASLDHSEVLAPTDQLTGMQTRSYRRRRSCTWTPARSATCSG